MIGGPKDKIHRFDSGDGAIRKTRTCIHSPGYPPLIPEDLSQPSLLSALDGANMVYFDGRFPDTALLVAKEALTEAPSVPSALLSMLLRFPRLKFVIATLGEDGCMMLERSINGGSDAEEMDVHSLLESLNQRKDDSKSIPTCISSVVTKLTSNGTGTVTGRLFVGTAEKIPPPELVDTTVQGMHSLVNGRANVCLVFTEF
ncbi:hypothetical protein V6N11_041391 [Hibiscus sabdariffa]|uniref:Uncharacterized protein n=1 Tax=Hibiscus sabdariffa TaxID=183260 RepID=A0ABR2RKD6_9ROSI